MFVFIGGPAHTTVYWPLADVASGEQINELICADIGLYVGY